MILLTLDEPWYRATLATAMRLHTNKAFRFDGPHWKYVDRIAHRLVGRFPDATRPQIEAALLHDVLADKCCQPEQLRGLGISDAAARVIRFVTPMLPRTPFIVLAGLVAHSGDVDASRVMLAIALDAEDGGGPPQDPETEAAAEAYADELRAVFGELNPSDDPRAYSRHVILQGALEEAAA